MEKDKAKTDSREKGNSGNESANGKSLSESATHRGRTTMDARVGTTARLIFIAFLIIAFCHQAAGVMIPLVLALFGSMMLRPPVHWLAGLRVPLPLAAAIVSGLAVIALASGLTYMGKPALEWISAAPETFPRLKEKFESVLRPAARLSAAASSVGNLDPVDGSTNRVQAVEVKNNKVAQIVFTWTGSLLAGIGETVGLVFLLLAFGDGFLQKLIQVLPTVPDKNRAMKISKEMQQSISTYLFAVGLINISFGAIVGIALYLLGMPNAMMWGGVAAVANLVPYFGPILGIVAVCVAGLLGFDTFAQGLAPGGVYLLLHLIEANFITPFLLGRQFTLNPVIIFVSLIFWAWLWGVVGALLAVPMLVTLKAVCERVPAFSFFGELISSKDQLAQ